MTFDHHPEPAIDFCIEVEELEAIMIDRENGFPNPDDATLERRIDRALMFTVGGDAGAIAAKDKLREIETRCGVHLLVVPQGRRPDKAEGS